MATMTTERIATRFIPKNSRAIEHPLGVCYVEDTTRGNYGAPYFLVMAYARTAGKRAFYEGYQTAEARDKRVTEFFAGLEARQASRAEWKAERDKPHTIKVGDIIHHSWGWEQTQCDYYQVLAVTAHGATIQAITSATVEGSDYSHGMADMRVPVPNAFHGEPMKVRISGANCVTTLAHGSAGLWDGQAKYCSWYG